MVAARAGAVRRTRPGRPGPVHGSGFHVGVVGLAVWSGSHAGVLVPRHRLEDPPEQEETDNDTDHDADDGTGAEIVVSTTAAVVVVVIVVVLYRLDHGNGGLVLADDQAGQ